MIGGKRGTVFCRAVVQMTIEHAISDDENKDIESIFTFQVKKHMKRLCLIDEKIKTEFQDFFRTDYKGFKVQVNDVQPHNWTRKLYFKTQNAYSTHQVHDASGNTQVSILQPLTNDTKDNIQIKKVKLNIRC